MLNHKICASPEPVANLPISGDFKSKLLSDNLKNIGAVEPQQTADSDCSLNYQNFQFGLLFFFIPVLLEIEPLDYFHAIRSTVSECLSALGAFDPEQIVALLCRSIVGLAVTFILGKIVSWLWQIVPVVLEKLLVKKLRLSVELTLTKFALSIELSNHSNNSD